MFRSPGIALTVSAFSVAVVVLACESPLKAKHTSSPEVARPSPVPAKPDSCKPWVARLIEEHEKDRTRRETREQTVRSLAASCAAIPEVVRAAAAQANAAKDVSEKPRILARAVTAALGEHCAVTEPLSDARQLAKACPLPSGLRFSVDDSILMDLRALDYGILLVMLKGLTSAGAFNEDAERMLLHFTLSAQILGEDIRLRETARDKRRRR
jgi:hypothetical protein